MSSTSHDSRRLPEGQAGSLLVGLLLVVFCAWSREESLGGLVVEGQDHLRTWILLERGRH